MKSKREREESFGARMETVVKKCRRVVVLLIARDLARWMDKREAECYDPFWSDDDRTHRKIRRASLAQSYFRPQWESRDRQFGPGWTGFEPFRPADHRVFVLAAAPKRPLP